MRTQTLELPVPPSVNAYFKIWRGRAVKTEAARAYNQHVMVLVRNAKVKRIKAPTDVSFAFTWHLGPDKRTHRGDLDNKLKCLLDSLNGLAWDDDNQISVLMGTRERSGLNKLVVSWTAV